MGRKKERPPTEKQSGLFSEGLPDFCLARHFAASSKTFVVPIWELPDNLGCFLNSVDVESLGHGRDAKEPQRLRIEGAPNYDFDGSEDEDSNDGQERSDSFDGTDFSGETDNAGASDDDEYAVTADASWSRAMVDKQPVLFRHISHPNQGEPSAPISYSVGFSTALIPNEFRRSASGKDLDEYMRRELAVRQNQWAVLAVNSSGHFAGAIFNGASVVAHKTFHRYTSRAKQGGSQASFDAQGKKAKSAGSNLRRYCQQRLGEEIRDLITKEWASEISSCSRVFIAASSRMRSVLMGTAGQPYICPNHVCRLPVPIARPTFEAVKNAYMQVSGIVFASTHVMQQLVAKQAPPEFAKASVSATVDELFTPLHSVAADGDEDRLIELLESGADPTAKDSRGRVPFELCASRGTRRAFREWSDVHEDAWDWSLAGVLRDIPVVKDAVKRRNKCKHKQGASYVEESSAQLLDAKNRYDREEEKCITLSSCHKQKGQRGFSSQSCSGASKSFNRQTPKKTATPKCQEARLVAAKARCQTTQRRLTH